MNRSRRSTSPGMTRFRRPIYSVRRRVTATPEMASQTETGDFLTDGGNISVRTVISCAAYRPIRGVPRNAPNAGAGSEFRYSHHRAVQQVATCRVVAMNFPSKTVFPAIQGPRMENFRNALLLTGRGFSANPLRDCVDSTATLHWSVNSETVGHYW